MLPFVRPLIPPPERWAPYLEKSFAASYFSNFGPANAALCRLFEERMGKPHRRVVTFANATVGITAALLALRLHGLVVCPAFTFPATAQAILAAGMEPLFCDIDPSTWELCPEALARVLGEQRPAAILHVRAFGFSRRLTAISALAEVAGIPLIVDAAAALGGVHEGGCNVGHEGRIEIFSLHATKPFGIGEGGMAFCDEVDFENLRAATNFGFGSDDRIIGTNAKMSEIHAAVGLAVADDFALLLGHRATVAARYIAALEGLPVELPHAGIGRPAWQTFPVRVDRAGLAQIVTESMAARGVTVRRYYAPALHRLPTLARHCPGLLPVTDALAETMVCLPIYGDMDDQEQARVIDGFSAVISENRQNGL